MILLHSHRLSVEAEWDPVSRRTQWMWPERSYRRWESYEGLCKPREKRIRRNPLRKTSSPGVDDKYGLYETTNNNWNKNVDGGCLCDYKQPLVHLFGGKHGKRWKTNYEWLQSLRLYIVVEIFAGVGTYHAEGIWQNGQDDSEALWFKHKVLIDLWINPFNYGILMADDSFIHLQESFINPFQ